MKASLLKSAILLLLASSCKMYDTSAQYTCQRPDSFSDGFDVDTLDEVNIDAGIIEEAVDEIRRGRYSGVHSMLIYRDGRLVLEEYFPGHKYQWDAPYSSYENPCIGIWVQEKDPISFILEMPLVDQPGTHFNYATGNMQVLGEIIRNASHI